MTHEDSEANSTFTTQEHHQALLRSHLATRESSKILHAVHQPPPDQLIQPTQQMDILL